MIALLAILAGLFLAFCQCVIFLYAPVETTLGLTQKVFYLHLPFAWWALFSFFLVFIGSIAWLWRRRPFWDDICAAAAEIGLLFSGLALISGMFWARKAWGVWWTWDPRLSTTLVMWFIYSAYLILRHMDLPEDRRRAICAVMGIAAFLDVPLVFLSARVFRSIHPAVFAKGGGLSPEMQLTVLVCIIGIGFLWLVILLLRWRQIRLARKMEALRQKMLQEDDYDRQ